MSYMPKRRIIRDPFDVAVRKRIDSDPDDPFTCWMWTGTKDGDGDGESRLGVLPEVRRG